MAKKSDPDRVVAEGEAPVVFRELLKRATAAEIEASFETMVFDPDDGDSIEFVRLQIPNGRRTRQFIVEDDEVESFLQLPFEALIALGDYVGFVNKSNGEIHAALGGNSGIMRGLSFQRLQSLPGVEVLGSGDSEPGVDTLDDEGLVTRTRRSENWRLRLERDGVEIEVGPIAPPWGVVLRNGVSISIRGVQTSSHDSALEALERYANAFLFDLDIVHDISLQLAKQRRGTRPRRREQTSLALEFPTNVYAQQALELYQYGRAATGLPLLEYLAYYQSIEHFFPYFAREETLNKVRGVLMDPRFRASDDVAVNRLINLAAPASRGGMGENEQLRATLRACTTESDIRDFVESRPEYIDHFCSKSQAIKGVKLIQLRGSSTDLRDQVADRVYALRCRIVHAKQDGGGINEEVLLPSSAEADSLQADIELVRMLAQSALVARASRA